MKKSKTFFACAMLAALASCSNDHVLSQQSPTPSDPDVINIVAASSKPVTKAANVAANLQDEQFADNEKINVYLYEHETALGTTDNTFSNNPYVYTVGSSSDTDGKQMTTTKNLYFPVNGKTVDAYAFYPALSGESGYDIKFNTSTFSVSTDQSSVDKYRKSDLMFGTNLWDESTRQIKSDAPGTAKGNKVKLHFLHTLTKIIVKLDAGDGFDLSYLTDATIKLYGAKPKADLSISKTTGITATVASSDNDAPGDGYNLGTYDSQGNAAIIIPQSIATGDKFIEITLSNNHGSSVYVYKLEDKDDTQNSSMTFKAGTKYTYKLKLSAGSVVVVSTDIKPWEDTAEIEGGADLQPAS